LFTLVAVARECFSNGRLCLRLPDKPPNDIGECHHTLEIVVTPAEGAAPECRYIPRNEGHNGVQSAPLRHDLERSLGRIEKGVQRVIQQCEKRHAITSTMFHSGDCFAANFGVMRKCRSRQRSPPTIPETLVTQTRRFSVEQMLLDSTRSGGRVDMRDLSSKPS